jgi:polyferredoxin/plastocyanin
VNRVLLTLAPVVVACLLSSCSEGSRYTGESVGDNRTIEVRARKFEYSPSVITVKEGETVTIKLVSEDVTHGFFLDGYGEETTIPPGETKVVGFTADKTGRFTFRCTVTCGHFHPYMVGHLRVLPNTKYYAGVAFVLLLGAVTVVTNRKRKGKAKDRLFGIIPLDWRFELTRYRPIRALFKSRWFPLVFILINFFVFVIVLIAGFIGGFSAGNVNFGVMVVWILWWVLLMTIFVPFVGRLWCMVCPFPLVGDWLQHGTLTGVGGRKSRGLNLKWPKQFRNLWPVTAVFILSTLFVGFFTVQPFATFALLAVIVLGAIAVSLIYEKRTFCLYLCPVSGFQGLYANFAACEVRVKDPEICKAHKPKTCYVGNEHGHGCPWMEMPFDMNRNTYCGLCLECFKTCPHDNMALNVRPFGTDLLTERKRTDDLYNRRGLDEAFKSLTMIGILFAFFLTMQGPYGWLKDMVRETSLNGYGLFVAVYVLFNFLLVPGLFLLVSYLSKRASGEREVSLKSVFVGFSYALIPIGVSRWAAFSLGILLPNGSYLPGVFSDPFGWGWNLFGTAGFPWSPFFTGALPYLQLLILFVGLAFSLEYGYKLAHLVFRTESSAKRGWIPMMLFILSLGLFFVWLFEG